MHQRFNKNSGFTLVELIVVIAIIGILAASAVQFIRNPLQMYIDIETRAQLTDMADSTLRKMAREIEKSLPNSVRVITSGSDSLVEFVPISNAGRYRAESGTLNPSYLPHNAADPLDFTLSSDSFDVLGPSAGACTSCTDQLVIFNLGVTGADVYAGDNRATVSSIVTDAIWSESKITFAGTFNGLNRFPYASPGSRFYLVTTPVSYACDMTNHKLYRYQSYGFQTSQPASVSALNTLTTTYNKSLLAENLSTCSITYNATNQRTGILSIALTFTNNGATVRLMHQIRVINSP